MTAVWQGAPYGQLVVHDGLVLGVARVVAGEVRALDALTGALKWSAQLPTSQPDVLGLIPGDHVVVAEVGHCGGTPAGWSFVAEDVVFDESTGHQLWTTPVAGKYQSPPIAMATNLVLTGDPAGAITARQALTGATVWQAPPPSGCRVRNNSPEDEGVGVAADGELIAASYECQPSGQLVVERLSASTGAPVWQWQAMVRATSYGPGSLSVIGAARQGSLVLASGWIPGPELKSFVQRMPNRYTWPPSLGPALDSDIVLGLDAQTGQPRWIEQGEQLADFTLTDGVVCETVRTGFECRDDANGAPSRPVFLTGLPDSATPPYAGDGLAGLTGSRAAVVLASRVPGNVPVLVVPIRNGAEVARTTVTIGSTGYGGARYNAMIVAAGLLPDGATLLLLRRVDLAGYPVLAIRVP